MKLVECGPFWVEARTTTHPKSKTDGQSINGDW